LTCVLWNLQLRVGMLLLAGEGTPSILSHGLIRLLRLGHRLPGWGLEDRVAISRSTPRFNYECERHALFDGSGQVTRSQDPLTAIQAHVSYTMRRCAVVRRRRRDCGQWAADREAVEQQCGRDGVVAVDEGAIDQVRVQIGRDREHWAKFTTIGVGWQYVWFSRRQSRRSGGRCSRR